MNNNDDRGSAARRRATGRTARRALALLATLVVAWFVIVGAVTGYRAWQANQDLESAKAAITAGDQAAASAAVAAAADSVGAVQGALDRPPLSLLRVVPYVDTNVVGAQALLAGGQQALQAAGAASEVFGDLTGDGQGQGLLDDGRIQYDLVADMKPQIKALDPMLTTARDTLTDLPTDVSPVLRGLQEKALAEIGGVQRGIDIYARLAPALPGLLGDESPQTYLVVFHNPAELYAGGGASLSAAVLQFDRGTMEVLDKGAVSSHFFPGNPRVPWDPKAGEPYYALENAADGFAWSNLHQDYRIAGEDLMRSWVANGQDPVDGVISLDPSALAAVLRATGPIQSPGYGEISADNLVQKLLYDGYGQFERDQVQRQELNNQLVDEMLARLQSGSAALSVGRAIMATAPEGHIRIHLSRDRLARVLRKAEVDGAQPAAKPDRVAFFTQNQNQSKVDIFQQRSVHHEVRLRADGSAKVVQTAEVSNTAPEGGWPLMAREGYRTRWAFHWNLVLLPEGARNVRIEANAGQVRRDDRDFRDIDGRPVVRIGRWIPPGDTSVITTTYTLPAGTFGSGQDLAYRATVEHQLLLNPQRLTVSVTGPTRPTARLGPWRVDDTTGTLETLVTRPSTIALDFGGS